jgi:hypothetical protein
MASYINAPLCSYPGTVLPIHDESYESYKKHLSGATVAEFPKAITPAPKKNTTINRFSQNTTSSATLRSRRSSYASSTKSQRGMSNKVLLEMLYDMQTELASYKAMMLSMQSRIAQLENSAAVVEKDASVVEVPVEAPADAPVEVPVAPKVEKPKPRPVSSAIPAGREDFSWWEACQRFADNCGTPVSAQESLDTSDDVDEFEFHFGGLATNPSVTDLHLGPASPPAVADLPSLTPTSDPDEQSQDGQSTHSMSLILTGEVAEELTLISTSEDGYEYDDIVERIVEFSKPRTLRPLLLHPPPTGKSNPDLDLEAITALPQFPAETEAAEPSKRQSKGIRGLFNYKKLSRTRSAEEKG